MDGDDGDRDRFFLTRYTEKNSIVFDSLYACMGLRRIHEPHISCQDRYPLSRAWDACVSMNIHFERGILNRI